MMRRSRILWCLDSLFEQISALRLGHAPGRFNRLLFLWTWTGLRDVLLLFKDGDISSSRNHNPHGLVAPLPLEVLIEPLPQHARVASDYVVLAWVVILGTIEDLRADPLLGNILYISQQPLLADIK